MDLGNRQQRETSQQITINSILETVEASRNNINAVHSTLQHPEYGLQNTKVTIDNIYNIAKKLSGTDENSLRTKKQEFKTSVEQMVKNAVKDYRVKRNDRKSQAKNLFDKIWKKLSDDENIVYEMNIETGAIVEELISSELMKLKELSPQLFEDYYNNHELEIVRELYKDLLKCIEDNVKLKDELEEYKLENKRINKKLDDVKKGMHSSVRELKNEYINIANPYLEKYFGV
jgi:hypothetical protein